MIQFSFGFEYFPRLSSLTLIPGRESSSIKVSLYPVFSSHITVEWSIPVGFGACTFNVYMAPSETGPWEKTTLSPTESNHWKIPLSAFNSKYSNYFYVVECIKGNGTKVQSSLVTLQNTMTTWVNIRAKEIHRREWLLLRKFTGIPTIVHRRKTFGKRCTECWDPVLLKGDIFLDI
jgi:hypothetical protein